jgi:dTDP-4-dehydrorhamnose reductase
VAAAVARLEPDLIVNAAAFTAVDRAESERETAFAVNRDGAAHLARAGARAGARVIHVSTDYVFDGRSRRPYRPGDPPAPLNAYGASKRAGETAGAAAAPDALIVRAGWLYSPHGVNFLTTMLRLMGEGTRLRVVADQIGAPTSAASLAAALWDLAALKASGLMHFADAGRASWCEFAVAIGEEAAAAGLFAQAPRVTPISTAERPGPAARPAFSVLDASLTWDRLGRPAPPWRRVLRGVLAEMAAAR